MIGPIILLKTVPLFRRFIIVKSLQRIVGQIENSLTESFLIFMLELTQNRVGE